ncbi:MAG: protoporphyrinogen oxidase [Actinomycetota bacterium]|nr:protoporphyrinogen oxidase [Actinomycetota bacterium]
MTGRPRVVVVGAGIAGLAAARALAPANEVVVLEADGRVGGKLVTTEFRGRPLDVGPDNFITRNDAATRLCREVGLGDELLAPATSRAAVHARGRPRALPAGLVLGIPTDFAALAGIVGAGGMLRAALDLVRPATAASAALAAGGDADPTVHEVLVPRLGRAVVSRLVDPLLGGINAGDCSTLSLRAVAPQLASAAAGQRSIVRALRSGRSGPPSDLAPRADGPGAVPLFLGLNRGIGSLVDALLRSLEHAGVSVRTSSPVASLGRDASAEGPPWCVRLPGEVLRADGVVLAVPAHRAALLLADLAPELSRECASVAYSGVATVTLAWPSSAVPDGLARDLDPGRRRGAGAARGLPRGEPAPPSLPGSGVLVPRGTGGVVTAASFTSTKWPRSARPGEVLVRASAGRDGDERALGLDDRELVDTVRAEIGALLGITAPPIESLVWRFPSSFPQYASGHIARAARIASLAGSLPGLALAGAAYDGIGIPACVTSGERAAAAVAARTAR